MSARSNARSDARSDARSHARSDAFYVMDDLSADLHELHINSRQTLNLEERSIGKQHVQSINSKIHLIQERLKKIDNEKAINNKKIYYLKQQMNELEARQDELHLEQNALQVQYESIPEQYQKACKIYNGETPVANVANLSSASSPPASSVGENDFADMAAGTEFSNSRSRCAYRGPSLADIMSQGKAGGGADDDTASVRSGTSRQSRQSRTSTTAFSQQAAAWSHLGL